MILNINESEWNDSEDWDIAIRNQEQINEIKKAIEANNNIVQVEIEGAGVRRMRKTVGENYRDAFLEHFKRRHLRRS